ncbi:MAG: hypothetical protein J1E39_04910 [Eubacterium sp.]|nr:hypothetical protein [Eubacterium sp.]
MKTDEIKWILYQGRQSDPLSRVCNDRLRRFGFCFVLDEYGTDVTKTMQLAIIDTLVEKELPNILIICPQNLMYNRYSDIVTGCGADFKMLNSSPGTIEYFSELTSNMYIASVASLKGGSEVLKKSCEAVTWDLVIIDATLSVNGIDEKLYTDKLGIKTDKLLIFAPFPVGRDGDRGALGRTAAALLADESKAAAAKSYVIDENSLDFSRDVPMTRHFEPEVFRGETARKTVLLRYSYDPIYLNGLRRMTDLKTGMPAYPYGGNIFEEYATDITRLYIKPVYTLRDVDELRRVDKKLDCFLSRLDDIIKNTDGRVAVYCVTRETANYLAKVIYALYTKSSGILRVERGSVFNTGRIGKKFERVSASKEDRIFITVDAAGLSVSASEGYTHIFNYELPDDPMVLEVRAARHVRNGLREFILFADDNALFDGRMLSKVMYGKIYESISAGLPGRNVLFDLPQAAEYAARCIFELTGILAAGERFTKEMILKFKGDFNLPLELDLANPSAALEYTKEKLDKILRALGIKDGSLDNERDLKKLVTALRPVFEKYNNSLLYLDENGEIVPIGREKLSEYYTPDKVNEHIAGLADAETDQKAKDARNVLSDYYGENKGALLRDYVNQLPDVLKLPVLLSSWKYLSDEFIIQDGFKEFMKKFNEGVM